MLRPARAAVFGALLLCSVSADCPAGTKVGLAGAGGVAGACVPCDVLMFSSSPNAASCSPCAVGTFTPLPGQGACRPCPSVGADWDAMRDWVADQHKLGIPVDPDSPTKLETRYRAGKAGSKAFKALCRQPLAHKLAKRSKKMQKWQQQQLQHGHA